MHFNRSEHAHAIKPPTTGSSLSESASGVGGYCVASVQSTYIATLDSLLPLPSYLVSWHLRTWVHFLARHEICTNNYILLQFPKETNTRGSKKDTFYSFSHKFTEFWLIKCHFCPITWRISCCDFKTILKSWEIWKLMPLNVSITHIQPRIYGFL